jgi:hypothetical protein
VGVGKREKKNHATHRTALAHSKQRIRKTTDTPAS